MEFEYVTRAEYKPVREELEAIIHRAQKFMREKYDTTFQYRLIGSGKRHLITRVKGGNGGYDFDYNLILPCPKKGSPYKAKDIKEHFLEAFQYAVKGTEYKSPKNSTSAVTIKVVNQVQSKILHSCDFAIIYCPNDNTDDGYKYLKNWKDGQYSFEMRNLSNKSNQKLSKILKRTDGWTCIREEYLKLKNNNLDPDKHSYILYLEAINNVYNHPDQGKESNMSKSGHGVSSHTHSQSQRDNYANQHNPNNNAYKADRDNHSNQCNPNNASYHQSRGESIKR